MTAAPTNGGARPTQIIVCCGVGGAGKTTVAATIGLAHALDGQRVAVLTIDPARRLADALGLDLLGNEPRPVSLASLGYDGPGTLDALMLDRKATFDAMVARFAPDPAFADRLLANPWYNAASTRLTGSHEYMATEKLAELVEAGRWDVVVLDTPPAQHAIDFFRAPERVGRLFEDGVVASIANPGKGLFGAATRRAVGVVERIAGEGLVQDVAEFFRLLQGLSSVLRERSRKVYELLRSDATRVFLVSVPTDDAAEDVYGFVEVLREQKMALAGLVMNRVAQGSHVAGDVATRLPPTPEGFEAVAWERAMTALAALPARVDAIARRHEAAMSRMRAATGVDVPTWIVPEVPGGVRTVETLAALASVVPPAPPA